MPFPEVLILYMSAVIRCSNRNRHSWREAVPMPFPEVLKICVCSHSSSSSSIIDRLLQAFQRGGCSCPRGAAWQSQHASSVFHGGARLVREHLYIKDSQVENVWWVPNTFRQ